MRHSIREALFDRSVRDRPVPSARLRHRVHGSTDIDSYLEVGEHCWKSILDLGSEIGRDFTESRSILDFGCGSGRTIRLIDPANPRDRSVSGVDIDSQAIRWCAQHLPGYCFKSSPERPPLDFPDNSFDLIYAISVFTHLDEAMQFAWLEELCRILKRGGVFIASVHGDFHRSLSGQSLDPSTGFAFRKLRTGIFKKDGLPDFYQDAQHSRSYIKTHWARYFRILSYKERGMAGHQDAVVMTKE